MAKSSDIALERGQAVRFAVYGIIAVLACALIPVALKLGKFALLILGGLVLGIFAGSRHPGRTAALLIGSVALGLLAGTLSGPQTGGVLAQLSHLLHRAWDSLGVALIGLAPLAIWLVRLVIRHMVHRQEAKPSALLDLAYISRNGPLLGLLGTVVALASAGATLAVEVQAGSTAAVLGVIPLVGQALLSTIVGIVLAVGADTTLHALERQRADAEPTATNPITKQIPAENGDHE